MKPFRPIFDIFWPQTVQHEHVIFIWDGEKYPLLRSQANFGPKKSQEKPPDSTFKLGQVYFMMGNKSKAKEFLEKAAAGTGNAARLASSYLEENF